MPSKTTYATILSTLMAVATGCDDKSGEAGKNTAPAAGNLNQLLLPASRAKVNPGKVAPKEIQPLEKPAVEVPPKQGPLLGGASGEASCSVGSCGADPEDGVDEAICGASCGGEPGDDLQAKPNTLDEPAPALPNLGLGNVPQPLPNLPTK